MIKTMKGIVPTWYTLESDETKETAFLLAPLTSAQRLNVIGVNAHDMLGETIMLVVKTAVKDFKGITDETGKALEFSLTTLETLPTHVLMELSKEIMRTSALTETERKN